MNPFVKLFSSLPLFAGTDPQILQDWLEEYQREPVSIPADAPIENPQERCLCILLKGCAQIQSADSGRNVILRELNAPGIFGAASLFCEGELPLSRITAKTACRILYIPLEAVRVLLGRDAGFRDAYLSFLAGRVRFLNRKILCFTAGSAERRLALWLISEENSTVLLPTSLTALADMLNIGRASLYRALDKLEAEGLIRRNGREITVISQDAILNQYQ